MKALALALPALLVTGAPVTQNGVTVDLWTPAPGSTVSNTIRLNAFAESLAGPIMRVEFYVDGRLIGAVTNKPPSPQGLKVY